MAALRTATADLNASLKSWRLWSLLGWIEIRQRYARSKLGPFWLTISMGVVIGAIGLVFGALLGQNMDTYLPMLSTGMVMWTLMSTIITEGCNAYINSAQYIRQVHTPRLIYLFQAMWRNFIIFLHNFVIVLIVLGIYGVKSWETVPLFLLGLIVLLLNAVWMAMVVGLFSARFRDLPQIVTAFMQMMYFVTPIMFAASALKKHEWIVTLNPFAYLIDLARQPLLGEWPTPLTWEVALGMTVVGWVFALALTGHYHKRIPYWL
ncbi:MAG: ABC transporter permease [Metallibacterium scheffleri]|jgi:lipopolysaccharide transport system permease protein|uniref:ABC transporter permease n=1 Tax=Metallibacterium scheffleri TaxID=993689 RepID=UPI0026F181E9|nr:ABC transporter permease [Metallibacterium scheffleri]MCK9366928.1 ABC transporter permease [Metallibacterium scheffleri]